MRLDWIARNVPLAGIFAFALASVWSLFQLFNARALHPTPLYWAPSALVEVVTAWLVYQAVGSARLVTRSRGQITDQDRRFNWILLSVCIVLATPTLAVSISANCFEFQGHVGLALLFPASCVACAVASAVPRVKARRDDERLEREREAHADTRAKLRDEKQETARLGVEVARLEAKLVQGYVLVEPSDADFAEICAKLDGNRTPRNVNIELARAGFEPMSESTIRGRLQ